MKNPMNQYIPEPVDTEVRSPLPTHLPSPGGIPQRELSPHTPPRRSRSTPSTPQASPRRFQWTTNGQGTRIRIHPYLNGKIGIRYHIPCYFATR